MANSKLAFTSAYAQGAVDENGVTMECTEFRTLLSRPDLGIMLGATGRWSDTVAGTGQILRYAPTLAAGWVVEYTGTNSQQVISILDQVSFKNAGVSLNIASSWGSSDAYSIVRDDATGIWTSKTILTETSGVQIRSFGSHTDTVSNTDYVFAGIDGSDTTIIAGTLNAHGNNIVWDTTAQLTDKSGYRVMAFAECEGKLYCILEESVYVYMDGVQTWSLAKNGTNPNPGVTNKGSGALRGLIANPLDATELLMCNCVEDVSKGGTANTGGVLGYKPSTGRWRTLWSTGARGGIFAYNTINYINGAFYIGSDWGAANGAYLYSPDSVNWTMEYFTPIYTGTDNTGSQGSVRTIAQGPVDTNYIFMAGCDMDNGSPPQGHNCGWCNQAHL